MLESYIETRINYGDNDDMRHLSKGTLSTISTLSQLVTIREGLNCKLTEPISIVAERLRKLLNARLEKELLQNDE